MKIATWNVNSINVRMPQLLGWLDKNELDVICFQETKTIDENFPLDDLVNLGYEAAFMGQKSYNGVAIISKFPLEDIQKNYLDDDDEAPKRLIAATTNGIRIVNTYIPNGSELWSDKFTFKLDWLQRLRRFFDETCDVNKNVLLCGDFNVAPEELDVWDVSTWTGKLHFSKPERAAMYHVKQWGFVDVFRKMNPDLQEFSWWNYREGAWQHNRGLRIDHIWTSPPLAEKCTGCWIDKDASRTRKTIRSRACHSRVFNLAATKVASVAQKRAADERQVIAWLDIYGGGYMSFSIFASGTGRFHFTKDDCIDDSDIDMVDLISKFQGMEPTWMGAGQVAIDIAQPSAGIIDLMQSMATMEFMHLLSNAVCFLAMKGGASDGWIFVAARESHLLWPDTGGNGKYEFYPGESPGTEFIKKIGPPLKEADMANWGVLRMLALVLAKFDNHISDSARPIINIELRH